MMITSLILLLLLMMQMLCKFETSPNTDTVTISAYHEDKTLPFLSDLEDINGDRVHWIKTAEIDIHTLAQY